MCRLNGICDKFFYDAETLDVPVDLPVSVAVDVFTTPWDEFVDADPSVVFFRDNAQEYVTKRWENLAVPVDELPFTGLEADPHDQRQRDVGGANRRHRRLGVRVHRRRGAGGRPADVRDRPAGEQLPSGEGHIYTTGSFDLATGTGTQTVVDCQGPALLCSGIEIGSTEFYTAQDLDASDSAVIDWRVVVAVDLGGTFGVADSTSTFTAASTD